MERNRPTALYRFYDRSGSLLYVGVTFNLNARFQTHKSQKPWWESIDSARTEVVWHQSRDEALAAERLALRSERPPHNIQGTGIRPEALWEPTVDVDEGKRMEAYCRYYGI